MAHSVGSLKKRIYSHLPPSLVQGLGRVTKSVACTLACLGIVAIPLAVGLLFSITYIVSFLYGVYSGHLFPSREVFLLFPALGGVFSRPQYIGEALLAYAFAGFVLSWFLQRDEQPEFGRRFLAWLGRKWNTISFLILSSLLLATLGEVYVSFDCHGYALAGILPYSDANDHYSLYTKYFYDGVMGDWVLRRPMAAFMGASIHWLAGNDPVIALMLRCLLVCCAMWASCAVMNKSFGVWSAIACLALEYSYIAQYLHIFVTETLGFFWGCAAAALWLYALREKRLFWELAAFGVTLVGLLVRMGSMFLVPALFLYVLWRWRELSPGHGWWKKPLLGLCLCVVAVALLNATFASRGVGDRQQTGSNFSYSFAGLTLGTDWAAAKKYYIKQLGTLKGEKQISNFLYKQGIKNILHSPHIFFKRLAKGEVEFLKNINFFLFHKWYLVFLLATMLYIRRKTLFSESAAAFWLATWGSILLSIPFIYFDESWRVNIFVYPLIACFFSHALARRHTAGTLSAGPSADAAPWFVVMLSGVLLVLMVSVALFPRLHTSADIERMKKYKASLPKQTANRFLVDPRGMSLLVVPDCEEPEKTLPSMTWSTFRDQYQKFSPSVDEALFTSAFPKPPFVVLVQAPFSGPNRGYNFFLAPPEVLSRKNILLWDFETDGVINDSSTNIHWKSVRNATPVLYK